MQTEGSASTLGAQLRRAREESGISLREVSDQTRISMRHLEAIEADNYKRLPGGLFNRSFIKAYARHIHFDENEALEAYMRTAREQGESPDEVVATPPRSRIYTDGDSARSPMTNLVLSALMLGTLVLGIYAALHWYRRNDASDSSAVTTAPTTGAGSEAAATMRPTPQAPSAVAGFSVRVKAKGEDVWLGARVDEEDLFDLTLRADQSREFTPRERLSLRYSKSKADALEVNINGRLAKAPVPNPKSGLVEWVVTKDDYKQFLQ